MITYEISSIKPFRRVAMPISEGYVPLYYGYVDESGDSAPFSQQPLVLVAVLTQSPRQLELLMRRTSKKIGVKSRGGELKGSHVEETIVARTLEGMCRLSVSIFAVEVDKSVIVKPPRDTEDLYAWATANLIRTCLKKFPRLELHLDKRYSNPVRQIWFERWIRDKLVDMSGISLTLLQEDSMASKHLQAADFLAWAAGKQARGDDRFWNIVKEKVVSYEVIRRAQWR